MIELLGYLASLLVLITFCTKTMVRQRIFAIGSNVAFIVYGALMGLHAVLLLHMVLLPLNAWRLWQILRLGRLVRACARASEAKLFSAMSPFACRLAFGAGRTVLQKGDRADALYLVIQGTLRVVETEAELGPGTVVGEIGVLSTAQSRTATLVAASDCVLGRVCARDFRRLYYTNPALGLRLARLVIDRLSNEVATLRHDPSLSPAQ